MNAKPKPSSILTFSLGNVDFCIATHQVSAVLDYQSLTRLPMTHPAIAGVFLWQSQLTTVLDGAHLLGIARTGQPDSGQFIVSQHLGKAIALWIDKVGQVEASDLFQREPLPPTSQNVALESAFRKEQRLYLYVELEKLINTPDMLIAEPRHSRLQQQTPTRQAGEDWPTADEGRQKSPRFLPGPAPGKRAAKAGEPAANMVVRQLSAPGAAVADPLRHAAASAPVAKVENRSASLLATDRASGQSAIKHPPSLSARTVDSIKSQNTGTAIAGTGPTAAASRQPESDRHSVFPDRQQTSYRQSQDEDFSTGSRLAGTGAILLLAAILLGAGLAYFYHYADPRPPAVITEAAADLSWLNALSEPETDGSSLREKMIAGPLVANKETIPHTVRPVPANISSPPIDATTTEIDLGSHVITIERRERQAPAATVASSDSINTAKPPINIEHVVVKGDTLWHIAQRYLNNPYQYPELAALSGIRNPDRIYPGDIVRIREKINSRAPKIFAEDH